MSAMCFCASVTRVKVKKIELAALACCYVRLPRLTPQNVHNAFSVAVLNVLRYGNTERVTCVDYAINAPNLTLDRCMSQKWFNAPNAPMLDLAVRGRKPKHRRVWVHDRA